MRTRVTLHLKQSPGVPIEADSLKPENVTGKSSREIASLPLWAGNREERVEDYFQVEVSREDGVASPGDLPAVPGEDGSGLATLVVAGDLSRFKRLGEGMTGGEMQIQGPAGMHAGAYMKGGSLVIHGNAGDWLGAQMSGGKIIVLGSAGNFAGAAYRGYSTGMRGGMIIIHEDAGQMLGARLRRGLIAVKGNCGDLAGFAMKAGTIIIGGAAGLRVGAMMRRGTLILWRPVELLPTFVYDCTYKPPFWQIMYNSLEREGFELPPACRDSDFQRFSGDLNEGGKGEILICPSLN